MSSSTRAEMPTGTDLLICVALVAGGVVAAPAQTAAVPDEVALVHVFRILQDSEKEPTGLHRKRINAYLATIKLGKVDCVELLAQANRFRRLEAVLAGTAAEVHRQSSGARTPDQRKQLQELDRQKRALLTNAMTETMRRLSPTGAQQFRAFLDERMKPTLRPYHP